MSRVFTKCTGKGTINCIFSLSLNFECVYPSILISVTLERKKYIHKNS